MRNEHPVTETGNAEDESAANFLDFFGLMSRNIHERERAIETLKAVSVHPVTVDVRADDQLLMLVTCTGADSERRVLAARRLREGE
ncbi:MAG: hypothetical protein IJI21_00125 [Clostridia bacterium]|nr:hypothetical protein [Clostridia bacterium]